MMRLIPVEQGNVYLAWKDAAPYLQKALETQDEYTLDEVYEELLNGSTSLWMFYNDKVNAPFGAMITYTYERPLKKCLVIFLMSADNFEDVSALFDDLTAYAKEIRANSIECYGRMGLEKLLKNLGFKKIYIAMGVDVK